MAVFTYIFIIITVLITIVTFRDRELFDSLSFHVRPIQSDGQVYRIISSMFLHVNTPHLVFNMFSFYSFALYMEMKFGYITLLLITIVSGVAGNLLALLLNKNNPEYRAVGASGAVSGVIFASIFLLPGGSVFVFPIPIPIPSWLFAILFILISIYGIGRGAGNIGHEAHLGGALAGIALAVVFQPFILYQQPLLLAALTIPVVLFILYFSQTSQSNNS